MRRLLAISVLLSACVTGPQNGDTTGKASVVGRSFLYEGYTDGPNEKVELQVLRRPDLVLTDDGNWATFDHTFTTTDPTYLNDPQHQSPLYFWSKDAIPVPTTATAGRWPQGGLIRTRAVRVAADGTTTQLPTFDAVTFPDCLAKHEQQNDPWTAFSDCEGLGAGNTLMAQTANLTNDLPAAKVPDYLGRKEAGMSAADTLAYYLRWGAPVSLASFKQTYGFGGASEVTATYYNDNDLGLGREMHCVNVSSLIVACYVSNYSGAIGVDFTKSADAALDQAVHRQDKFATVAMVYNLVPPPGINKVNFVVYNAAGNQQFNAQLDSTGKHTAVPTNCLACHGISSSYDRGSEVVVGDAQFLPFDLGTFKFSTVSGFTLADQQGAFRKLNAMVKLTVPSTGIAKLIDGMYAPKAVTDSTAVWNDDYVPSAWQGDIRHVATYNGIIKKGCRTCHTSATNASLDFLSPADWDSRVGSIRGLVCGASHNMPQAERVSKNLWASGARAYLISGSGVSPDDNLEGCAP